LFYLSTGSPMPSFFFLPLGTCNCYCSSRRTENRSTANLLHSSLSCHEPATPDPGLCSSCNLQLLLFPENGDPITNNDRHFSVSEPAFHPQSSMIACVKIFALVKRSSMTANSSGPCILFSLPGIMQPNATPFFSRCTYVPPPIEMQYPFFPV